MFFFFLSFFQNAGSQLCFFVCLFCFKVSFTVTCCFITQLSHSFQIILFHCELHMSIYNSFASVSLSAQVSGVAMDTTVVLASILEHSVSQVCLSRMICEEYRFLLIKSRSQHLKVKSPRVLTYFLNFKTCFSQTCYICACVQNFVFYAKLMKSLGCCPQGKGHMILILRNDYVADLLSC